MNAIEIVGLKKYYGKVKAVDDVSFAVPEGEIFGFLGPNGAGKTTTLRAVMNFQFPTAGQVRVFGRDVIEEGKEIRRKIGYFGSPQQLYDTWTGETHLRFVNDIRGGMDYAQELAQQMELNLVVPVKKLSSGNRQKLGIVLALMSRPKLVILDEPTNALDPLLQQMLYTLLEEVRANGSTIFLSSHNLAEVERICDSVAIIKDGKLVAQESMANLRRKHLYRVSLTLKEATTDFQQFLIEGDELLQGNSTHFVIRTKQDAGALLDRLKTLNLHDMEIRRGTLEDIFLEYYR